jgi:hypothetical protein
MAGDGGLRPLFRKFIPWIHWQSVETGGTGLGVPDSNYCGRGVEGWVEYKWTAGWAVTLSPEQVGWHCRRARAGGRTFIAVRRRCPPGPRRAGADELWLLHGRFAPDLRSGGLRSAPPGSVVGCWPGGPARWDWEAVGVALTSSVAAPTIPGLKTTPT